MEQLFFHSLHPGIVVDVSLGMEGQRAPIHSLPLIPPLSSHFLSTSLTHLPLIKFVESVPQLMKGVLEASVVGKRKQRVRLNVENKKPSSPNLRPPPCTHV